MTDDEVLIRATQAGDTKAYDGARGVSATVTAVTETIVAKRHLHIKRQCNQFRGQRETAFARPANCVESSDYHSRIRPY